MKAHLAAIPLVLLEQVSALQPQLDVRGDWAEDVFAALRRDHIRAPLDMTEPRLEPLLDDKGAEDEMAISLSDVPAWLRFGVDKRPWRCQ